MVTKRMKTTEEGNIGKPKAPGGGIQDAPCIVLSTHPNREDAMNLGQKLVADKLAACVQVEGPLTSVYVWEGKTETAQEWRMVMKTTERHLKSLETAFHSLHPFKVPQWLVLEAKASSAYHSWLVK
jgi:periplasmic divalent cation tolerance protein